MGRALPLLTADECSYVHFRQYHLIPNEPCFISPSLVEDWPIKGRIARSDGALDWGYLEDNFGQFEAVCADCDAVDGGVAGGEAEARTFGDLLKLWKEGTGRAKYLKDWHLPLLVYREAERLGKGKGKERVREELYDVPSLWLDDWMNEWEGSEGEDDFRFVVRALSWNETSELLTSSTAVRRRRRHFHAPAPRRLCVVLRLPHQIDLTDASLDCSYSISTQLYGRKRWYLFPPSCTPHLRPLIAEAEREDTSVNCDKWSKERKAEFRKRGMVVVEQQEGESIFMCVRTPRSRVIRTHAADAVHPATTTRSTTSPTRPSRSITTGSTRTTCRRCTDRCRPRSSGAGRRLRMSERCWWSGRGGTDREKKGGGRSGRTRSMSWSNGAKDGGACGHCVCPPLCR